MALMLLCWYYFQSLQLSVNESHHFTVKLSITVLII